MENNNEPKIDFNPDDTLTLLGIFDYLDAIATGHINPNYSYLSQKESYMKGQYIAIKMLTTILAKYSGWLEDINNDGKIDTLLDKIMNKYNNVSKIEPSEN